MMTDYDNWKTACCGNYPNCHPCPYSDRDEEGEPKTEAEDWRDMYDYYAPTYDAIVSL